MLCFLCPIEIPDGLLRQNKSFATPSLLPNQPGTVQDRKLEIIKNVLEFRQCFWLRRPQQLSNSCCGLLRKPVCRWDGWGKFKVFQFILKNPEHLGIPLKPHRCSVIIIKKKNLGSEESTDHNKISFIDVGFFHVPYSAKSTSCVKENNNSLPAGQEEI